MPDKKIKNLISELHEIFAREEPTPQQKQLLDEVERHIHGAGSPERYDPNLQDTLNLLVEEFELSHPKASTVVREVLEVLKNIGV